MFTLFGFHLANFEMARELNVCRHSNMMWFDRLSSSNVFDRLSNHLLKSVQLQKKIALMFCCKKNVQQYLI